jgi:transposase
MLLCEIRWETSQQADPAAFASAYEVFCIRARPKPTGYPVADARKMVENLLWFFTASTFYANPPYMLAKHWQAYDVESHGSKYPIWLHANDVPTLQAAHAKNPDLHAYLKDRARTWSSNYIAADLRINVWAARVCLDLFGIRTPCTASRPPVAPRAETGFIYDSARTHSALYAGYSVKEIATELGVTESFLRRVWRNEGINPSTGYSGQDPEVKANHKRWLNQLRNGTPEGREIEGVSQAAACWDISDQAARNRLRALGWQPYTSVWSVLDACP